MSCTLRYLTLSPSHSLWWYSSSRHFSDAVRLMNEQVTSTLIFNCLGRALFVFCFSKLKLLFPFLSGISALGKTMKECCLKKHRKKRLPCTSNSEVQRPTLSSWKAGKPAFLKGWGFRDPSWWCDRDPEACLQHQEAHAAMGCRVSATSSASRAPLAVWLKGQTQEGALQGLVMPNILWVKGCSTEKNMWSYCWGDTFERKILKQMFFLALH